MRVRKDVVRFLLVLAEQVKEQDKLSKRTIARLEKALKIYQKKEHDFFVVSGGIFNPPHIQTLPAAELMKEWLKAQGIERECILVEDESLDSFQNVQNSVLKIREEVKKSPLYPSCQETVTVVSDLQHLSRIKMIIEGHFLIPVSYEDSGYRLSLLETIKEMIFFAVTFFDRDGVGRLAQISRDWRRQD